MRSQTPPLPRRLFAHDHRTRTGKALLEGRKYSGRGTAVGCMCRTSAKTMRRGRNNTWQTDLSQGIVGADWETKDDFIKDLQKKNNKWKSGNISELQVATFGSNTAVSHYILPMTPDSG